jgi:two-component system response regulator FlrC
MDDAMPQTAFQIETPHTAPSAAPVVLVVERDRDIASEAIERLRMKGVTVEQVDNGAEALERLVRQPYALVLIDSAIDGRQGLDLLAQVAGCAPGVPVVMTTGAATVKHAVAAMQAGAVDYLMKPVRAEALEACVLSRVIPRPADARTDRSGSADAAKPFITATPEVENILETGRAVAGSKATILITGESGTGKEVLAAYIHRHACPAGAPYVAVNCAALPESLMESELFGYEKGAFTGALARKQGKFEQAGTGTLVLDEISEMPLGLQAKLLRVLQEKRIDPIGGEQEIPLQAQVIAISNRDLGECVRNGQLREDLYYRINVIPLHLPPLRERRRDIPLLVRHFTERYSCMYQRPALALAEDVMADLTQREWKGNIRELENTIERAVLIGRLAVAPAQAAFQGGGRTAGDSPLTIRPGLSVKDVEEALIKQTLTEVNNHREQAARMLGISVRTLRNKLNTYRQTTPQPEKDGSS